jgi:putative transposase
VHDKHGVAPLLITADEEGWRIRRAVGGLSYGGEDSECAAAIHGIDLQISSRPEDSKGFTPQPLRWRVEPSLGILTNSNKRLVRDFERSAEQSETVIKVGNARRAMRMCIRLA